MLKAFKDANPAGEVLLISGFGTLETAVQAVRAGAFDYISKPFNIAEVKATVDAGAGAAARRSPPSRPRRRHVPPDGLVGRTRGMLDRLQADCAAADSTAPVLIPGRAAPARSWSRARFTRTAARAARPFVAINCGAIAETLLESELFGHARGAFTGAMADRKGVFEQAHGGTVFLDEIGETPPALQVKLLRVLQDGEVRPVGAQPHDPRRRARRRGDQRRPRATPSPTQRFREDLYYRLNVIVIRFPPLRDGARTFRCSSTSSCGNAAARAGRQVDDLTGRDRGPDAYRWPGNVRELENTIERLVVFSRGRIDVAGSAAGRSSRRRRSRNGCSRICRRSRSSSGDICSTCSRPSAATVARGGGARHRSPDAVPHGRAFGIALDEENEKAHV